MYLYDLYETENSGRVCSISENVALYGIAQQRQNVALSRTGKGGDWSLQFWHADNW